MTTARKLWLFFYFFQSDSLNRAHSWCTTHAEHMQEGPCAFFSSHASHSPPPLEPKLTRCLKGHFEPLRFRVQKVFSLMRNQPLWSNSFEIYVLWRKEKKKTILALESFTHASSSKVFRDRSLCYILPAYIQNTSSLKKKRKDSQVIESKKSSSRDVRVKDPLS